MCGPMRHATYFSHVDPECVPEMRVLTLLLIWVVIRPQRFFGHATLVLYLVRSFGRGENIGRCERTT